MAIEKVFNDPKANTELRCFLNERNELYIELTDCINRYSFMYLSLPIDEVKLLIDHINEELEKAE